MSISDITPERLSGPRRFTINSLQSAETSQTPEFDAQRPLRSNAALAALCETLNAIEVRCRHRLPPYDQ
jgi:hypothetical protein